MSHPSKSSALERARGRSSRRAFRIANASLTTLTIAMGSVAFANGAAHAEPASDEIAPSEAVINQSLDSMAKLVAGAVTDDQFRQEIYDGAAKQFDGDTNVLWETLADEPGVQSTLATTYNLEGSARSLDATSAIESVASEIPRFQVAVPAKFDEWDPAKYTPLVAYMPQGVDDTTLETVTAYDASGTAYELDAQVEPANPVIVLGVNERTDENGNLLENVQEAESTPGFTTLATKYQVRMVKVNLLDDKEPWTRGAAEINLRAKSKCGDLAYSDYNWVSLDDNDDWWYGPRVLGTSGCDVVFYWWEDDGSGGTEVSISFKGVSLGIKLSEGDDRIGGAQIAHSWFSGGSNNKTEWSALHQWTD